MPILLTLALMATSPAAIPAHSIRPTASVGAVFGSEALRYRDVVGEVSTQIAPAIGVYGRAGVLFSRRLGIDFEVLAGTIFFADAVWRVAATVNVTPVRALTIGIGPTWGAYSLMFGAIGTSNHASYVGGTVRLDLHPWAEPSLLGMTYSLVFDLGKATSTPTGTTCACPLTPLGAGGAFAMIGYSW